MDENRKKEAMDQPERKRFPRWAVVLLCIAGVLLLLLALAVGWFVDEVLMEHSRRGPDVEDRIEQWADGVEAEVEQWAEQTIGVGSRVQYEEASQYQKGACGFPDPIRQVEIHWISGTVRLEHWDGENVVLEETEPGDTDQLLRWRLIRDTLVVQYCAPGSYTDLPAKDLVVKLPVQDGLSVSVETVSADCTAVGLQLVELEFDSASGQLEAEGSFRTLSAESVSGAVTITGQVRDLEVEITSGTTALALQETPEELAFDSVSGDLILTLPGERSFVLETETVSGSMDCELPLRGGKEEWFYDSGTAAPAAELELSTVSGALSIKTA